MEQKDQIDSVRRSYEVGPEDPEVFGMTNEACFPEGTYEPKL